MAAKTQIFLLLVAGALALVIASADASSINHGLIEVDTHPINSHLGESSRIIFKRDADGDEDTKKPKKKKKSSMTTSSPSKDTSTTKHPATSTTTKHPATTSTKHPSASTTTTKHPTGSTSKPSKSTTTTGKPDSSTTPGSSGSHSRALVQSSDKGSKDKKSKKVKAKTTARKEEMSAIEYAIAGVDSWVRFHEKNKSVYNIVLAGEFLTKVRDFQERLGSSKVRKLISLYKETQMGEDIVYPDDPDGTDDPDESGGDDDE